MGDVYKWLPIFHGNYGDSAIKRLIKEYEVSLNTQQDSEDGNINDNHIEELHKEPMIEHIVADSPHVTVTKNIEDLRCQMAESP